LKKFTGVLKGSLADDELLWKQISGDGMETSGETGEHRGHEGLAAVSPSKDKAIDQKEASSPEELRNQSLEQRKLYSTLKREGKNAEALQAFKRHKDLSREADALELTLKKLAVSQRRALAEGTASTGAVQKPNKEISENEKEVKLDPLLS
jgi:hypothetical protein